MREIKFRAKTTSDNEWVYGYFFKNANGDCCICEENGTTHIVQPDTVCEMVYKNNDGEEFYEGDYIYFREEPETGLYLIVYNEAYLSFLLCGDSSYEDLEQLTSEDVTMSGTCFDSDIDYSCDGHGSLEVAIWGSMTTFKTAEEFMQALCGSLYTDFQDVFGEDQDPNFYLVEQGWIIDGFLSSAEIKGATPVWVVWQKELWA